MGRRFKKRLPLPVVFYILWLYRKNAFEFLYYFLRTSPLFCAYFKINFQKRLTYFLFFNKFSFCARFTRGFLPICLYVFHILKLVFHLYRLFINIFNILSTSITNYSFCMWNFTHRFPRMGAYPSILSKFQSFTRRFSKKLSISKRRFFYVKRNNRQHSSSTRAHARL